MAKRQAPKANPKLRRLLELAKRPEATPVMLHWLDAGFSNTQRLEGNGAPQIPKGYRGGCPDCTIGFYLGTRDGCVMLGESVYIRDGHHSFRHIWDIPEDLIIKVEILH